MRNSMRTNRSRKGCTAGRSLAVKIGAILLALCMVAVLALPAFAAESSASVDDGYTYTVRIFPGDKGTIDGSDNPFIKKEVAPGYEWSRSDFDFNKQAKSKTDKYRVTGMRESGKDNNTNSSYSGGGFVVDRDIDLVVSYGIKGSEVAYTVNYLEYGTDNKLTVDGHSNPETFYGNIGEKPVVSYLYVDGYTPQYRNLTKTLSENAAENEFTFYYVKNETPSEGGGEGEPVETEGESSETEGGGETTTGGEVATATQTTTTTTGGGGTTTTTRTVTQTTPAATTTNRTTTTGTAGGTGAGTAAGAAGGTGTAAGGTGTAAGGTGAGTAAGGTGTGTAAGGTGTGTGTGTDAGGAAAANNANGAGTQVADAGNGTVNTQQNGPQEIVDLDEQQTPLAEYNGNSTDNAGSTDTDTETETPDVNSETEGVVRAQGMSTPAKILLALAIILALGGAGWFFFRRFATDDDDEEDDEDDDESPDGII